MQAWVEGAGGQPPAPFHELLTRAAALPPLPRSTSSRRYNLRLCTQGRRARQWQPGGSCMLGLVACLLGLAPNALPSLSFQSYPLGRDLQLIQRGEGAAGLVSSNMHMRVRTHTRTRVCTRARTHIHTHTRTHTHTHSHTYKRTHTHTHVRVATRRTPRRTAPSTSTAGAARRGRRQAWAAARRRWGLARRQSCRRPRTVPSCRRCTRR